MHTAAFYLYYPLLKLLSLLPMRILYLVADFLYVILYYVFGYRKAVVYQNLKLSFPEKSEIFEISKQFYQYLADLFVETVKSFSISKEEILSRLDLPKGFIKENDLEGKSFIILLGHNGNWEWAGLAFSAYGEVRMHAIYHQLSIKKFDELMFQTRGKFGSYLSKMEDTMRSMIKFRDQAVATILIADQNTSPKNAYWTDFLNRKTAFVKGPFKLAQKFDQPIIYGYIKRVCRGKYVVKMELISYDNKNASEYDILERFVRLLEKDIIDNPSNWLWSHKRWKHEYEDYH
jgi:Kdo2-lipid IVA lauroyltransferase/acyltransferase